MKTIKLQRISIILLLAMCISLFSCVGNTPEGDSDHSTVGSTEGAESTESIEDRTEATVESDEPGEDKENQPQTPADTKVENGDETEESETEDPRLSAEYAPVKYFDAKDVYELTKDGIYEDMAQLFFGYDEVTYHTEEGEKPYTKLLTYNDSRNAAEAYISLCTAPMDVAPIFAVKYRTTTPGINMEIYTDSVNLSVAGGNNIRIPITSDGEWHIEYVNLARIKDFNGKSVNYFRFDFMNAVALPVDSYVDFQYIGFFNTEDDIEMFETGKYVPTVYVDPNSAYKESVGIVHASSIDMINGAGGIGATVFNYRGGNSKAGIDKFNHNATTLSDGLLVFSGWTVVDGGIEKFVWSVDGLTWHDVKFNRMESMGDLGQAHITATQSYTDATVTDIASATRGGGYQGNIGVSNPEERARGLACDLSEFMGQTVNVRFAAVPKSAPDTLCLIAYVKNVTVVSDFSYEEETEEEEVIDPTVDPEKCGEHQESIYWYPVEGQLSEAKLCTLCGTALTVRALAYYSSFDIIEHSGSNMTGGYGANAVVDKDCSSIILRKGLDFVVQGWFACNGGVKDYMYSVDGGETWLVCGNSDKLTDKFKPEHIAAINKVDLGIAKYDLKGMYRLSIPLEPFASDTETTVNVLFGACPANNPGVVITIANLKNVKIPAAHPVEPEPDPEPDTQVEFIKAIDKLDIGSVIVNNPAGGYGGALFTYNASATTMTTSAVTWHGWAGVTDGFAGWVYSIDGGETWLPAGGSATDITRTDIQGAINGVGFTNFASKGMLSVSADLSAHIGKTVSVIFGGIPNSNSSAVLPMVKITDLKVGGICAHTNVQWSHVSGQSKESGVCAICGDKVTRDVMYLNNIDIVEGMSNGASYSINPPDGTKLISSPSEAIDSRANRDIVVQGWVAVNGGVQKYVYSVDGGATWLTCGNQPAGNGSKFTDSANHVKAINGANLGFTAADADLNGMYRVSCDLSSKAGETVQVIFGIVLEENPTADPVQLLKINVNVAPNS